MLVSPCCLAFAQLTSLVCHKSIPHPHPERWKGLDDSLGGIIKSVGLGCEGWEMVKMMEV